MLADNTLVTKNKCTKPTINSEEDQAVDNEEHKLGSKITVFYIIWYRKLEVNSVGSRLSPIPNSSNLSNHLPANQAGG